MSLISIVAPVYNNPTSLADLLEKFQVVASQHQEDAFEFVFVDDGSIDHSVRVLHMLERLGYAVIAARSGREVVDLLKQRGDRIDMVIMDLVMPDMNSDQILKAILNHHSDAKVVLSSGFNPDSVGTKEMFKTTYGFLQKPYQMAELSRIVQTTLTH